MKIKKIKVVSVVLLLCLSLIYMVIPNKQVKLFGPDEKNMDNYVESKMTELRIPGLALGVINNDSIYMKGYGVDSTNSKKVTEKSPFLLGSTTKSITAMAVMQLVEKGKIDLDEEVIEYLPDFSFQNKELSDEITIRQLLNHTSGIGNGVGEYDYLNDKDTRKEFLKEISEDSLTIKPGEKYEYSEGNYVILGEVISIVSGETYENYIQKNIFQPLNMNNSFTSKEEAMEHSLVEGNVTWFGYPIKTDLPYPKQYASASAVYSSVEDLTHYMSCYLNEGKYQEEKLLSQEGIESIENPAVKLEHPTGYAYGMGWFINDNYVIHDGRPTNYYSIMLMDSKTKKGVIILANANNRLITAEYIMPMAFEIMNELNGQETMGGGLNFRYLYKIINLIFLWIFIVLLSRLIGTIIMLLNKNSGKGSSIIKAIVADFIISLPIVSFLCYMLKTYGVSIKVACLGQPDIMYSIFFFLILIVLNIGLKSIGLFTKKRKDN